MGRITQFPAYTTNNCAKQVVLHNYRCSERAGGRSRRWGLQLFSEGEVAGVADAGDDVAAAGELLVDGGDPEGDVVAVADGQLFHGITACDGGDEVDGGGFTAILDELVDAHFHGGARGDQGIGDHEGLALERRCGAVVHPKLEVVAFAVLPVGGQESRFGMVEEGEEALLQREGGPEDAGDDDRRVARFHRGDAKRCLDLLGGVGKNLGQFQGENLSDPFEVDAETQTVFLDGRIAQFREEGIENGRFLSEIDDLHGYRRLG